jgi:hypothetical protein
MAALTAATLRIILADSEAVDNAMLQLAMKLLKNRLVRNLKRMPCDVESIQK